MILAILLIYFIGKRFYDLSEEYSQNKWLYAILGVIIYFAAQFIFGAIIGILDLFLGWGIDWESNNIGLNLIAIPIGLLAVWGFYTLLQNRWKKTVVVTKDEIHNIGRDITEIEDDN